MSFSAGVTLNHSTTHTPSDGGTSSAYHLGLGDTVLIYSFVPREEDHRESLGAQIDRSVGDVGAADRRGGGLSGW